MRPDPFAARISQWETEVMLTTNITKTAHILPCGCSWHNRLAKARQKAQRGDSKTGK